MSSDFPAELPPLPAEAGGGAAAPTKPKREPASLLNSAMVVYVFINLMFALPLLIAPTAFFDLIGIRSTVSDDLGGLRWVGAVLLAWAISGILVLARPEGRAIFVTTGALQLTLAAATFVYSWSISEYEWSSWYHVAATAVLAVGGTFMWWARLRARSVLKGSGA